MHPLCHPASATACDSLFLIAALPAGNYWELLEAQQYNLTLELPAAMFQYNNRTWEGDDRTFQAGGKGPGLHWVRAWKAHAAGVVFG